MAQAASSLSRCYRLVVGLAASIGLLLTACGTDAKGIDACREIEQERCRQAPACSTHFRIKSEEDVESCVRFYRDQCLHGLSSIEPGKPALDACLQTIRRAGSCARSGAATLAECSAPPSAETSLTTACDILLHPERTAECAFLVPAPEEPPPVTPPTEDAGADAEEPSELLDGG